MNATVGGLIALAAAALVYFLATGGGRSLAATVSSAFWGVWPRAREAMTEAAAPLAVFVFGCSAGVARYYYALRAGKRGRRRMLPRERSRDAD